MIQVDANTTALCYSTGTVSSQAQETLSRAELIEGQMFFILEIRL